jgi:hypothetical protein
MQVFKIILRQKLVILLLSVFTFTINPSVANTDMKAMGEVQKAREKARQKGDHSKHNMRVVPVDKSQQFRGVYYGYLPCDFCAGIKMTLSLKNKKNYLLVIQYAQSSNREFFEKGKYEWNEKDGIVTLVSRKDSSTQRFIIKNEGALIKVKADGTWMKGNQDQYTLLRTDKKKGRELHIH